MKTITKIKTVLLLVLIAGFVSCKGPMGPAGPAGADGKDGVDGKDGNANVTASPWITPEWSDTNSDYGNFVYNDSTITSDFMNTGVILSYTDLTGLGEYVYALPFTFQNGGTVSINFNMEPGKIKWWFQADHNYTPHTGMKVRYVLIPASTTNKSLNPKKEIYYNLEKAGVDVNDYFQVMDYYGLEY